MEKTIKENAVQLEDMEFMPKKVPPLTNVNIGNIYSGKLVKGLQDGTSPFLPKNGAIDLKPAYNMYTNTLHKNVAQIEFQLDAAENGYKNMAYVSLDTLAAARASAKEKGIECGYIKGSKPVTTFVQPRDKDGQPNGAEKAIQWYNIEQIENPEFLKNFCNEHMTEQTAQKNAFIEQQKSLNNDSYKNYKQASNPAELDLNKPNEKSLKFSGNSAADYLGQILAAMSSGCKLIVEDSDAKKMSDFMIKTITTPKMSKEGKKLPQGIVFNQFIASANEKCKTSLKILHDDYSMKQSQNYIKNQKEEQKIKSPSKNQEYERSR